MFKIPFTQKDQEAHLPGSTESASFPPLATELQPQAIELPQRSNTTISADTEVRGNLIASGYITIFGTVIGNITVDSGSVRLMSSGKVEGDIHAPHIAVDGYVHGICVTESLELLEHGKINGTVKTNKFSIKSGGIFIGQSELVETAANPNERPGNSTSVEAAPLVKQGALHKTAQVDTHRLSSVSATAKAEHPALDAGPTTPSASQV